MTRKDTGIAAARREERARCPAWNLRGSGKRTSLQADWQKRGNQMSDKSISLFYNDLQTGGTSDKEYNVQVHWTGTGYQVNFQYGRRGGTLQAGSKTPTLVSKEAAEHIFDGLVAEKMKKGYQPIATKAAPIAAPIAAVGQRTPYPIEDLVEIATEHESDVFLNSLKYWLQTKNDGDFRQIQKLADGSYLGFNKLGNVVSGLPSEVVYELKKIKAKTFFLAGELVGNRFIAENQLELNGTDLSRETYAKRFETLEYLILANARHVTLTATWRSRSEKLEGMKALMENRCEGGVYKLITAIYRPGAGRQHFKYKFVKTLSAVVVGLGHKGHNSATIALVEAGGKMIEVGHVSLNGKPKINVNTVVEVDYLYGTEGRRLYQARLNPVNPIRTDVPIKKCTIDQIIYKEGVNA